MKFYLSCAKYLTAELIGAIKLYVWVIPLELYKPYIFSFACLTFCLLKGVSILLSHLLRSENLYNAFSYAYSPPPIIHLNDNTAESTKTSVLSYFQEFVTCIIVGNDLFSRLSVVNVRMLDRQVHDMLIRCDKHKFRVFIELFFGNEEGQQRPTFIYRILNGLFFNNDKRRFSSTIDPIETDDALALNILEEDDRLLDTQVSHTVIQIQRHPPSFLVGKLIHFIKDSTRKRYIPIWTDSESFHGIRVSSTMLLDHLPNFLGDLFRRLEEDLIELRLEGVEDCVVKSV